MVGKEDCGNLERALSLEWLETNGRGGFASGTVSGANTRRYHALLLTARKPPSERFVLVNHLEEWVEVNGQTIPLSTNFYPGAIYPEGYRSCSSFAAARLQSLCRSKGVNAGPIDCLIAAACCQHRFPLLTAD